MGRPKKRHLGEPKEHKGQWRVWWNGAWHPLGPADSPKARAEYARLAALWAGDPAASPKRPTDYLVAELCADFLASAQCPAGRRQRDRVQTAVDLLLEQHLGTAVAEFGPNDLRAWQAWLCGLPSRKHPGRTRFNYTSVKYLVDTVRTVWKWGASTERVEQARYDTLCTVERPRRADVRPPRVVEPADPAHVRAAMPFMRPPVRAMVFLEWMTGARPDELCRMRAGDVKTAGKIHVPGAGLFDLDEQEVWAYNPHAHKLAWKGKHRLIQFAGDAQAVLAPFLGRDPAAYCFSPREALAGLRAEQRQARLDRGGGAGGSRKPTKRPEELAAVAKDHYTPTGYRQAVKRACLRAGVPVFFPYMLRHASAAEIKASLGIDAVMATLGHHTRTMSEHYGGEAIKTQAKVARARGGAEKGGPAGS